MGKDIWTDGFIWDIAQTIGNEWAIDHEMAHEISGMVASHMFQMKRDYEGELRKQALDHSRESNVKNDDR